jgi:predicted RNA-binding Zn-ribbon protein involved in translation (DUF1610 family)
MNDIKFSCPGCGQHLMVAASGANATVACPQCGQATIVPSPAPAMVNPERTIPGAKVGDGPAPKVPERHAVVAKKKSPVAMVAALAILVCIAGIALFMFREKIFKSTEYWTLDVNAVDTPDVPARGRIHGKLFTAKEMHIEKGGLTIRTPQNPPEAGVSIIYQFPNPIESLYGKTLLFEKNTPGAPGVLLRWKNAKGKKTEQLIYNGYCLRIEFDDSPEGNHVSGKIYLCVDDQMKSYVVGKFYARIYKP